MFGLSGTVLSESPENVPKLCVPFDFLFALFSFSFSFSFSSSSSFFSSSFFFVYI